ncbi:NAD-dependent epimerase/dehydratase family protein [Sphingobacterium bambusae]|uniref:NAD-dependent epimerase/dehydratase family protein n=1 Tax=Sphingobacterium bambusae TaxID=662858 RepID=A0ABW6BB85_9SPHI|nr:NAD-dependent epimerase/dehydratase family protein [Sphingobacterium bambusae]WPL46968.1 NAD-dependent epimerase/dehydratase family protein [Sphingobacterium bambusae]
MKVTIIGGSGFVGTRLIENLLLSEDVHIANLDKKQSDTYASLTQIADVTDASSIRAALPGTDVVVLLAAEHRDDVSPTSLYYDVNVQGTQHVLEAMAENNVKHIIFASSVAVYGLDKENPTETLPADPFNHYGKSKWQAEEVLQAWFKNHSDWTISIVRPTVIFGEGNRGNVWNLLNQIASGKFMMIGPGTNRKSMAYVGNVVAFLQFLIQNKNSGYEVYNYVDKPDFTTNDLVYHTGKVLDKKIPTRRIPYWLGMLGGYGFDVLAWVTRKKLPISSVRVQKFCAVTQFDSSKAMGSGFVPPFSMEEGLRRTLKSEFGK